MAGNIDTIIDDIYALFGSGHKVDPVALDNFGKAMAAHVQRAFDKREPRGALRGSMMGETCERKAYLDVNNPELAETISPEALLKFLYGHLLEELGLFLVEETGKHTVTARQELVNVNGIEGHPDAIIDGWLVDVKSANSRGMDKFTKHTLEYDDPFGYLGQLDFYRKALIDDPRLTEKDSVAFLAIDKELGKLKLDKYYRGGKALDRAGDNIARKQAIVNGGVVPQRAIEPVPDGKSGNMALGIKCRYCDKKKTCWADANNGRGLRTFIYSNGPRWLTRVVREPDVPEKIE